MNDRSFIDLVYHGVFVIPPEDYNVIFLRVVGTTRILPIWIGEDAAAAIAAREQGRAPVRPRAHDVLLQLADSHAGSAMEVRIDGYVRGRFTASLVCGDGTVLDMRPSDAILLAREEQLPISVAEDVLRRTGVFVSADDLSRGFGIDCEDVSDTADEFSSASGDAQADADFESLLRSMGVEESDLRGDSSEDDKTDR
ncbi:bifunctional nuclease family protein [Corynebacterium sp. TAE3-ERU2]|uniref:bifunctional nuclease family protein n=1 Tax=Corynebacterium sp. TAE3-ERU2 TaxID=2849497 RepID=UPI001C469D54|nr:bifunctional nuclease family protein [Corynebacterium sp. TAE3-ERU2]MBV7302548.1 bifunctional nuclease family protein [Corynebacterium sp. TAE3-ERU2]